MKVPVKNLANKDVGEIELDDAVFAELFDHAVDVHRGNSQRFAHLLLGERQLEAAALDAPDHLEARAQFCHDVGEPRRRGTLADVDDPLAKHRSIDQGVTPEDLGHVRPPAMQFCQGFMTDKAERARRQRGEVVIHHVQKQAHEIGDFARDVKGEDLPLAVGDRLGAHAKAFGDQAALGRRLAVTDHRLLRRVMSHGQRQGEDLSGILLRNCRVGTQPPEERCAYRIAGHSKLRRLP